MNRYFYGLRWFISIVLLIPVLWLPPMALNENLQKYSRSIQKPLNVNSPEGKLLIEEHKKAVDEISLRLEQGNDWFKWKFLVVGGFIMGAFTFVRLKPESNSERSQDSTIDELLKELLSTHYLLTVLALAVVLSIVIDLHERHNIIVTNQLGLWITYYVEPAFYGKPSLDATTLNNLLGWEQFIRQGGHALHTDTFGSVATWTLLH